MLGKQPQSIILRFIAPQVIFGGDKGNRVLGLGSEAFGQDADAAMLKAETPEDQAAVAKGLLAVNDSPKLGFGHYSASRVRL